MLIGLNGGAFDNGGVCGDGERWCECKCSSFIIDDDDGGDDDDDSDDDDGCGGGTAADTAIAATAAVSSRSMPSNKGNADICANANDTGGVAGARGDNSGVVGVDDIAIDIIAHTHTF